MLQRFVMERLSDKPLGDALGTLMDERAGRRVGDWACRSS